MKCSSKSTDASIISGVQWIRMAMYQISWSRAAEIRRPLRDSLQAVKGVAVCAACDHHRQAEELPRSPAKDHAQCRASPEQGAEQPSGEFTSADQIAREGDEAVQVSASRPALPLGLRDHHVILSSGETSVQSAWLSRSDEDKIRFGKKRSATSDLLEEEDAIDRQSE
jgi:hypothetical protein